MDVLHLAPLHGITTHTFRRVFFRHFAGFDGAMAPFITTVHAERVALSHLRDVAPENNVGINLIPQVIGNDPAAIIQLTNAFAGLGYSHVNLNLGCPFVKVTRKGRGSGLLPQTDRIVAILDQVTKAVTCGFSVKARLGMESSEELFRLLPLLDDVRLECIVIHPRTGRQEYGGNVDLGAFERCLALTRHRVIYNGDIASVGQFQSLKARFNGRVDGWMIGRGALKNPLLPSEIRTGAPSDPADATKRVQAFVDQIYRESCANLEGGPMPVLNRMKEIWGYLSLSFDDGRRLLKRIQKSKKLFEYEAVLQEFFSSKPVWKPAA